MAACIDVLRCTPLLTFMWSMVIENTSCTGHSCVLPRQENNYDTSCVSCGSWEDCTNCTIDQSASSERCTEILPHTSNNGVNDTLETLRVDPGFWRTSQRSTEILACYNEGACSGGVGQYCAQGYTGPCEITADEKDRFMICAFCAGKLLTR